MLGLSLGVLFLLIGCVASCWVLFSYYSAQLLAKGMNRRSAIITILKSMIGR